MNQIAPLAGAVPAHIAQSSDRLNLNDSAMAGVRPAFTRLRFDRNWFIRQRGEDKLIATSPGIDRATGKDLPEVPVQSVSVIVVGVAEKISKRYYIKGFHHESAEAPDCFSVDGMTPDAASKAKQSPTCAACPMNVWGSKVNDNGKKVKACQDRRRIAVVPAEDVENADYGGPMLFDLPPTGLMGLEKYSRELKRLGADISEVVTVLSSVPNDPLTITFDHAGYIANPDDYALAKSHWKSDLTRRIIEEELIEVTADVDGINATQGRLAQRPAHLQQATPVQAPEPAQAPIQAAPEPALAAPSTAARKSPFGRAQAQAAAPASAKTNSDTPPAETVIQGAPKDMESIIDNIDNLLT
jgi:hypothetical protein